MDDPYPLFSVFAFLGFTLVLIPLPWHFQAWNSGTCFYMIWTAIACLNQFVNSVVWAGNALNPAPIWCDISIRIILGASVGIPASSLCINRRLYQIARVNSVTISHAQKRRAVIIDSLICVLFPLMFIALQYIVQGHRFDIFADIGCYPAIYNTLPTYFLSNMLPILLGIISGVYSVLSLREFIRRRAQFSEFISSNKSLTVSRYLRLMALSCTEILFTTPLAIFITWLNLTAQPLEPWKGWADAHFDYGRVEQIPSLIWRRNGLVALGMELTRWVAPLLAFVFFGFFGFAEEARKHYRLAFWAVAKRFGFSSQGKTLLNSNASIGRFGKPKSSTVASIGSLPVYVPSSPFKHGYPASPTSSASTTLDEKPSRFNEGFVVLEDDGSLPSTTISRFQLSDLESVEPSIQSTNSSDRRWSSP